MNTWRKLRLERGLTLLEVLVSLACASIALISFLSLIISSVEAESYARNLTKATLLAERLIKETQVEFPEPGDEEGKIEEEDGFYFRRHVRETIIGGVREVTLEILWDDKRHGTEFVFYVRKR